MAMVFDNARQSPLYNYWLGFECERWPTLPEALLLEWAPVIAVLLIAGATGARLGESVEPSRGAVVGGLVAALGFALRTLITSIGFFGQVRPAYVVVFGIGSVAIGVVTGLAGGTIAKRFA